MATPTKWGNQILVNTFTDQSQQFSAVAHLANGGFVAAWTDGSHTLGDSSALGDAIHGQVFNADGSKRGAEFLVNTTTADLQDSATLVGLADGRFVAAWSDNSAHQFDIRAQIFNVDGSKAGAEFVVNTTTAQDQAIPQLAALTDGRFVVAWADYSSGGDIRAQMFNGDGSRSGDEFLVNTTTAGQQDSVSITALSDGFVVAWGDDSNPVNHDVRAQVFDAYGNKSSPELVVDPVNAIDSDGPSVTALAGGKFAVAWTETPLFQEAHVQIFDANGSKPGPDFKAGAGTITKLPALATLDDGRFVALSTFDFEFGLGIDGQVFEPDGAPSGAEFTVDADLGRVQSYSDVTVLADGRFVVTWTDLTPGDGSSSGVRAQIFDPRETGRHLQGTALNDDWVGTKFADTMKGGGGDDRLVGGLGSDTLHGDAGDDTAVFSHDLGDYLLVADLGSKIVVSGPDGLDTLTGIEHLQFSDGTVNVDDGNPLFDTVRYMRLNPDVFHSGANALEHFDTMGWHEGRDPNGMFDTKGYLAANPDVKATGVNPLDHYHQSGWHEGRDPGAFFDTTLYLINNPDVAAAGVDPLAHYLQFGIAEGRQAYRAIGSNIAGGFDAEYYLFHNPDVAASGADPLQHFNTFGWHEGRNPNAYFDTAGYLAHYADVAASGANPLQHYEQFGWHEGRDPSAAFDTLGYLAANPDVAAAGVNPLDHFLQNGIYEGRSAMGDGLWH